MKDIFHKTIWLRLLAACTIAVAAQWLPQLRAQEGTLIYLKDGRALEAQIAAVGATDVSFRISGIPSIQKLTFEQISYVDFPKPEVWEQAMMNLRNGNYENAVETFKQFSLQKGGSTGYPAPGNLATLADRRLIDCYRRMRSPEQIAYIQKRIEWDKLPSIERGMATIVDCWAAVGNEQWDPAREAVKKAEAELTDTDPASAELAYLKALIESGGVSGTQPADDEELKVVLNARNESVVYFGRAFGPDAGADPGMAKEALRQSIEKITGDEERVEELKALLHLYAGLHGNGSLWPEADEYVLTLFAEGLEIASTSKPKKGAGATAGGPLKARYIRIERIADEPTYVTLAEVELIHEAASITRGAKATQSSDGKIAKRKRPAGQAADGKTAPGVQANTFSRTDKEDAPWWELDLGEMKAIGEVRIHNCKNTQGVFANPPGVFRLTLLDGSRVEVFRKEDIASPEPDIVIKVEAGVTETPDAPKEEAAPEGGADAPKKTAEAPEEGN